MKLTCRSCLIVLVILVLTGCSDIKDFQILDGEAKKFDDYKGKWLIVNFWAEWCSPCREEVPELNKLASDPKFKDLEILGVSFDPISNAAIRRIADQWQMQYPIIASTPNPILPFKLPKALPANFIINPNGELVTRVSGAQTHESLSKLLNSLKIK